MIARRGEQRKNNRLNAGIAETAGVRRFPAIRGSDYRGARLAVIEKRKTASRRLCENSVEFSHTAGLRLFSRPEIDQKKKNRENFSSAQSFAFFRRLFTRPARGGLSNLKQRLMITQRSRLPCVTSGGCEAALTRLRRRRSRGRRSRRRRHQARISGPLAQRASVASRRSEPVAGSGLAGELSSNWP